MEIYLFAGVLGEIKQGRLAEIVAPWVIALGEDELEIALTHPTVGNVP